MLITGDLGFGVLTNFANRFPKQFLNAGVAEQNMTMLATGLAMEGRIVFTYSIGNFPTLRALEMIRNDACYHDANVNVVCIGGGFSYGQLGISHHATEDIAILRSLPQMTVVAPGDDFETKELTKALCKKKGAGYLRLDRTSMMVDSAAPVQLGKARKIHDGNALTLISTGGMLGEAVRAHDMLRKHGIETRVLSMHSIKPLDEEAIFQAVTDTGGIVTLEEHTTIGGLGGAVAEICLERHWIPNVFHRFGLQSQFSSVVGDQDYLRKEYGLDAESIAKNCLKLLEGQTTGVHA